MGCAYGRSLRLDLQGETSLPYRGPPCHCNVVLTTDNCTTQGGKFHIVITLPKEYPFKPPTLSFRTKIYHPNVSNDERGAMCLGMLKSDEWKPPNKIKEVVALVRAVLSAPQPDDAVEPSIADTFRNNRADFDKQARDWVTKYAK